MRVFKRCGFFVLGLFLCGSGFGQSGPPPLPASPWLNIFRFPTNFVTAFGGNAPLAYPQRTNTYAYDAVNRLTNMADAVGASSFAWTPSGQLASETAPWASSTLSLAYSQRHRATASLNTSATTLNNTYGYDSGWRLTSLSSSSGTFGYGYSSANPASALFRTLSLPNAANITNYYDSMAHLLRTFLTSYFSLNWRHRDFGELAGLASSFAAK